MYRHNIFTKFFKRRHALIITRNLTKESSSDKVSIDYCTSIVKRHDYENFLATLLLTKAIRSPAFVVRAFNVEVARIQDQTSDAQTAAFRLQFWQDAINGMFKSDQTLKNIPANPVAQELFKVCCCYSLQKRQLEKLVTSRHNLLKLKHFQSLEDFEKYSEDTVSTIYYILLKVANIANVNADHAASHLGKAQGIATMLRSVQVASRHKMVALPMDILMKFKISQEEVLRGIDSENMRNVIYEIASRANSHLQKAKSIDVPKHGRQIFLPAAAVDKYLVKLQKCNFNVFDKALEIANPMMPFSLYYNRLFNKF